jgi:hypothetical protein
VLILLDLGQVERGMVEDAGLASVAGVDRRLGWHIWTDHVAITPLRAHIPSHSELLGQVVGLLAQDGGVRSVGAVRIVGVQELALGSCVNGLANELLLLFVLSILLLLLLDLSLSFCSRGEPLPNRDVGNDRDQSGSRVEVAVASGDHEASVAGSAGYRKVKMMKLLHLLLMKLPDRRVPIQPSSIWIYLGALLADAFLR